MNLLVTAGPTREFLDPVRFLSNRSTGKMGYALAEAGVARGHAVRLISGPVSLGPPEGAALTRVTSAADMLAAVLDALADCDALVMCAAVADWRPKLIALQKLKKSTMSGTLELERTADILQAVKGRRRPGQLVVGFAAETENLLAAADGKRSAKGLDLIVANDVSRDDAGFEVDTNAVCLVTASGVEPLPLMSKRAVAERILDWIESNHRVGTPDGTTTAVDEIRDRIHRAGRNLVKLETPVLRDTDQAAEENGAQIEVVGNEQQVDHRPPRDQQAQDALEHIVRQGLEHHNQVEQQDADPGILHQVRDKLDG